MAQRLIRIDLEGYRCKGLYLEDSAGLFGVDVIDDDKLANKVTVPFKIILRSTVQLNGKSKTSKQTFPFNDKISLKKAIDGVNTKREGFRAEILNPKKAEQIADTTAQDAATAKLNVTLGDYWENDYCPYKTVTAKVKEQWRTSTEKDMKSFYNTWIKTSPMHDMKIIDIEDTHIEALISVVKSKRSLRTAKKVTEALAPLFKRFYTKNQIAKLNPANIDLGDLNNVREVVVSIEEAKRLYDAMMSYPIPKYRHVFTFLATGRRLNEVLSLTMSDIDKDKNLFDIHEDISKSKKKLKFVLRAEMMEALEDKSVLVHPSDKNTKMDGSTIRNHWEKVKINAGLISGYDEKGNPIADELHIHDLRHIIATVLRDSSVTEEISALVLGHTRSSITARYASQNAQLANEVYQFFLDKINCKLEPTAKWVEV